MQLQLYVMSLVATAIADACKTDLLTPPKGEQAPQTLEHYKMMMAWDADLIVRQKLALTECQIRNERLTAKLLKARQTIQELRNAQIDKDIAHHKHPNDL